MSLDSSQPAGMLPEFLYALGLPLSVAAAVIGLWQAGVMVSGVSPIILPAPSDVLLAFDGTMGELVQQSWATGSESLLAFLLSCALGLAVALVLSSSVIAFEAFYPNIVVFQIIPKIALAPLFTFWLGIAAPSRLTYAVFISFFPVALSTMTGLARANTNALRLCRALGASRWQIFFAVKVPYSLPYFLSGAKVAATMSVTGIVVGEFISANQGLGYYILRAQSYGRTPRIFAALVFLCALGLLLYLLPMGGERLMRKWWHGRRRGTP
jgi:NitT/TauT family transport system permease protein